MRCLSQAVSVLNQISTTLVGLAVAFFGGVAILMQPSQRSLNDLKTDVDKLKTDVNSVKTVVNSVKSDVKNLGIINITINVVVLLVVALLVWLVVSQNFGQGN